MEKRGRNSSIELLRVICLLLIFWMHSSGSYQDNGISAWVSIAVNVIGNIGVSCFILISGYYGVRLNVKKLMHLELMLIFYSWTALALQLVWGNNPGGKAIVSHLLPVIGGENWYFTCYFALVFLSPFINEIVDKMSEAWLRRLIITMLVIFSGITTFFFFDNFNKDGGKGIIQMVMLYLIGRYIGVYKAEQKYKTGKLLAAFGVTAGINFCLNGVIYVVTGTVQNKFARDDTLFTIFQAVLIFLIFRNFYFENRLVNRAAKHVPAAFLFEWTLRSVITLYIVDYLAYAGENYYQVILLLVAALLVILGVVIDWLRVALFHVPENWIVERIYALLAGVWAAGKHRHSENT